MLCLLLFSSVVFSFVSRYRSKLSVFFLFLFFLSSLSLSPILLFLSLSPPSLLTFPAAFFFFFLLSLSGFLCPLVLSIIVWLNKSVYKIKLINKNKKITHAEQRYPDSFIVILSDFNKANLTRKLPKYRQHITCPTRDSNILDHCYTVLKDAYHSVPSAALGLSGHSLVHLLPAYRQKLKSSKPVLRTVKIWTVEAEQDLQACFELPDWSVF